MKPNVCDLPSPAPPNEASIYRGMRDLLIRAHCSAKREAHQCAGRITITRDSVTLQCPRCGDLRQVIT